MAKVRWTREAETWLREIRDYIAKDSPTAAARTVQGVVEQAKSLSSFPQRGYRYRDRPDENIRIVLYGNYRIPYLIRDSGDIDILGVFHRGLAIERFLGT